MINPLNLIHCLKLSTNMKDVGLPEITFSYSESTSYKDGVATLRQSIYVDLWNINTIRTKYNLSTSQIFELIRYNITIYIEKTFKDEFNQIVEEEISEDMKRVDFYLL